jgi:predicted nucleotidyltransferase
MKNCINIVKEIVLEKVPLQDYAVFLFGSRALGNNHEMSDIDISILGNKPLPVSIKLNLEQELEDCIVPFKVDIIDFNGVSDKFKKYALEKIEIWNLSKNSILNY